MSLDLYDAALSCSTEATDGTKKLKSKVVAPKNPKLLRGIQPEIKVVFSDIVIISLFIP